MTVRIHIMPHRLTAPSRLSQKLDRAQVSGHFTRNDRVTRNYLGIFDLMREAFHGERHEVVK